MGCLLLDAGAGAPRCIHTPRGGAAGAAEEHTGHPGALANNKIGKNDYFDYSIVLICQLQSAVKLLWSQQQQLCIIMRMRGQSQSMDMARWLQCEAAV